MPTSATWPLPACREHRRVAGGGMTAVTAWRTDEPCPVCATGLIMTDDGSSDCGLSAACAAGPTPGPATTRTEVTSDRNHRHDQDDAGGADGHAAGPAGRPGPGRRARRVHPPGAAAPHQPRHRRRGPGARPVRAHPGARSARRARSGPGRCGPRSAGKAGTSRTNPTSPPTRPPRTSSGGSCCAPRPSSNATPPRRPERTPPTLTSSSPSWMRRSPRRASAGR